MDILAWIKCSIWGKLAKISTRLYPPAPQNFCLEPLQRSSSTGLMETPWILTLYLSWRKENISQSTSLWWKSPTVLQMKVMSTLMTSHIFNCRTFVNRSSSTRRYMTRCLQAQHHLPKYMLLEDFMQRSLLGHIGNHNSITLFKFKIFKIVVLNLNINWAR